MRVGINHGNKKVRKEIMHLPTLAYLSSYASS